MSDTHALDPSHPSQKLPWLYFAAGLALGVGLHIVMALAVYLCAAFVLYADAQQRLPQPWADRAIIGMYGWALALSAVQLLYLGPAWLLTFRWRPPMAHGILTVGVITFLLQSSCYGIVATIYVFLQENLHH